MIHDLSIIITFSFYLIVYSFYLFAFTFIYLSIKGEGEHRYMIDGKSYPF